MNRFIPPHDTRYYLCRSCGHRFTKKPGLFGFFIRCPKCGSVKVTDDPFIQHCRKQEGSDFMKS